MMISACGRPAFLWLEGSHSVSSAVGHQPALEKLALAWRTSHGRCRALMESLMEARRVLYSLAIAVTASGLHVAFTGIIKPSLPSRQQGALPLRSNTFIIYHCIYNIFVQIQTSVYRITFRNLVVSTGFGAFCSQLLCYKMHSAFDVTRGGVAFIL